MISMIAVLFFVFVCRCADELPPCTNEFLHIAYGPCTGSLDSETRDIVFYTKDSECDGVQFEPPSPIRKVNCSNTSCPEGTFYNFESSKCESCLPGSQPKNYATVYSDFNKTMPSEFRTSCWTTNSNSTPCKNWTAWSSYLTADVGQPQYTHTYLNLSVDIWQREGEIYFEYLVPTSRYYSDYMTFSIDGVVVNGSLVSDIWDTFTFPLYFGHHTLSWQFVTSYYYVPQEIGARIRKILISGTHFIVTQCEACPAGTYSKGGSQCAKCLPNQIPSEDVASCVSCSDSTYSFPGDVQCKNKPACKTIDYTTVSGLCLNGQKEVTYEWITPQICDPNNGASVQLPSSRTEACNLCDAGYYKSTSGNCIPCEAGHYRTSLMADDKCVIAPAGSYPVKSSSETLPTLNDPSSRYQGGCDSDTSDVNNCASSEGWRNYGNVIDSSNYHYGPVTVWLHRSIVNPPTYGVMNFTYVPHLQTDSYFKYFASSYYYRFSTHDDNDKVLSYIGYYYSGETTDFYWLFIKTGSGISATGERLSDNVDITSLTFQIDTVLNGGVDIKKCAKGTYAEEGQTECTRCPYGNTTPEEGATACTPCADNEFTWSEGATECVACGNNTIPKEDKTNCEFVNCGFYHNESFVFDLSVLQTNEEMLEVPMPEDFTNYRLYLDVCTNANSRSTCRDYYDGADGGDETFACTVYEYSGGTYYYSYIVGTYAHFNYWENVDAGQYGVNITYTRGSYAYCGGSSSYQRSLEIDFICLPNSGRGAPSIKAPFEDENCGFHYEWVTEYACKLCQSSDYEELVGDCQKGKRKVTYVQKEGVVCQHGVALPKDYIDSCPNPLVKIGVGGLVGIIFAVLIILGVSIFIIVYFVRKNRALRYQINQKKLFNLGVERSDEEEDKGSSSAPVQEEQYKSVDFSGSDPVKESAY